MSFSQGRQHQPEAVLQLSHNHDTQCSYPDLTAGYAMGVKFLAKGNNIDDHVNALLMSWKHSITQLLKQIDGY